ncbi:hypothetical protein Efla_002167 [Eimeria flavescens]
MDIRSGKERSTQQPEDSLEAAAAPHCSSSSSSSSLQQEQQQQQQLTAAAAAAGGKGLCEGAFVAFCVKRCCVVFSPLATVQTQLPSRRACHLPFFAFELTRHSKTFAADEQQLHAAAQSFEGMRGRRQLVALDVGSSNKFFIGEKKREQRLHATSSLQKCTHFEVNRQLVLTAVTPHGRDDRLLRCTDT